jgi:hypothetical protein
VRSPPERCPTQILRITFSQLARQPRRDHHHRRRNRLPHSLALPLRQRRPNLAESHPLNPGRPLADYRPARRPAAHRGYANPDRQNPSTPHVLLHRWEPLLRQTRQRRIGSTASHCRCGELLKIKVYFFQMTGQPGVTPSRATRTLPRGGPSSWPRRVLPLGKSSRPKVCAEHLAVVAQLRWTGGATSPGVISPITTHSRRHARAEVSRLALASLGGLHQASHDDRVQLAQ